MDDRTEINDCASPASKHMCRIIETEQCNSCINYESSYWRRERSRRTTDSKTRNEKACFFANGVKGQDKTNIETKSDERDEKGTVVITENKSKYLFSMLNPQP